MNWLIQHIQQRGPLSVADYMQLCLYHPQHGYYTTNNPLGTDFITAPETSQMFGEMIAVCLMDQWQRMGKPAIINLIEMGPGQGTLMADLLRVASADFREALRIHMVEVSPTLRQIQQQKVQHPHIQWHQSLDEALRPGPTFFVANELFDALPIQQKVKTPQGWVERRIVCEDNALHFCPTPDPDHEVTESCPMAYPLIQQLSQHLLAHEGLALIIDYGYEGPAAGDTLQALRRHQYHGVLQDPGQADLTAHVDFTPLAHIARASGARVFGPIIQRDFLESLGIQTRAKILRQRASPAQLNQIDHALHRLLDPSQMGTLFKVMALGGGNTPTPAGFSTCTDTSY